MRNALVLLEQPAEIAAALEAAGFSCAESTESSAPLDVLVCELISPPAGEFLADDNWHSTVSDAVAAPFRAVRQALPRLTLGTDARVIIVIDGWRAAAHPHSTAAAAANGALIALVKTLARDLGDSGITVNAIARDPGGINGPGLARAVGYLASPLAGALTGQIVTLGSGGEIRP